MLFAANAWSSPSQTRKGDGIWPPPGRVASAGCGDGVPPSWLHLNSGLLGAFLLLLWLLTVFLHFPVLGSDGREQGKPIALWSRAVLGCPSHCPVGFLRPAHVRSIGWRQASVAVCSGPPAPSKAWQVHMNLHSVSFSAFLASSHTWLDYLLQQTARPPHSFSYEITFTGAFQGRVISRTFSPDLCFGANFKRR